MPEQPSTHNRAPGAFPIRTMTLTHRPADGGASFGQASPIELLERSGWKKAGFLLEGTPGGWFDGRFSVLGGDPFAIFQSKGTSARFDLLDPDGGHSFFSSGDPLEALQSWIDRFRPIPSSDDLADLPFHEGGAVGFFSYELARQLEKIEPSLPERSPLPDIYLPFFNLVIVIDHLEDKIHIVYNPSPEMKMGKTEAATRRSGERKIEILLRNLETPLLSDPFIEIDRLLPEAELTPEAYVKMVQKAKEYIAAGDIFQANLSHRFKTASTSASLSPVYRKLRQINPSPFSAYLNLGEVQIASGSPERLVRIREEGAGQIVETRPIAGTRPRGGNDVEDRSMIEQLRSSEKERAEHLMLVDLERNDLGKVCRYGTVQVDALMEIEKYSHVLHLVSNIRGELLRGTPAMEVLRAVFPGGTITGVPKVRCMEIISELEGRPRGIYTGALGYIRFSGEVDLNIAIRTWVRRGEELSFHVGAGIVADSDPDAEYQETLQKGAALIKALRS